METINQPSANPTNKVTGGTLVGAAAGFVFLMSGLVVRNLYPGWYDAEVWASGQVLIQTAAFFAGGWFTRDKPNVVVKVEQ